MYVILKQIVCLGDATGERNRQQTSAVVVLLIVFIDECMKRTSFLLWDRISPSYREHFSMLMWHFLAYFWHTVRCNIPGPELQHFRYDRRRTDGDLTVIAGKMAKFLLQDNISPSSKQHFWGVYIPLHSLFLALHYALYNSSQYPADMV